jgi:hypothetical protein
LQLEAIYRKENPTKLPQLPALLQKYAGNEAVLYAKVCKTYDSHPKVFHLDPKDPCGSVLIDVIGVPILPNPPPPYRGEKEEDGGEETRKDGGEEEGGGGEKEKEEDEDDEEDEEEVTISTMSGKETEIAVQLRFDTVMQLRKDVAANLGIPVWASSLCMGTKVLEPDLALFDAGVANGTRLTLIRQPIAKLEKEFNKLRFFLKEPAQDPAAQASNGSRDGVVYVVQDPQHEFLGVFKNRSAAVEAAIERARAEIEQWLDDRFQPLLVQWPLPLQHFCS